jgi:uncharacterized membrane protein
MKIPENIYYHPIFVHFPQALFPVSFLSFVIYIATGAREFEVGSFIAALFGTVFTPMASFTGFLDWKIRYKGYMTPVFRIKIISAFLLFGFAIPAILLRTFMPEGNFLPLAGPGWIYGTLLAACTLTNVILGHYGGKLVFH